MNKKILGITALTCTLAFSQIAFAKSSLCGESLKDMVSSLKLDDAQKDKIKPVLEQLKTTMKDNGSQMSSLESQIDQQVNAEVMDNGTVNGLVDKKAAIIGNMMKAKITAKNQILNILKPEQKTELQNKMKKMEEKMAAEYKSCTNDD